MNTEEALIYEWLYDSLWKCKRGKMWKASVSRFVIDGMASVAELTNRISSGKYEPRKPHHFTLYYPKLRPCSSIHISDRVVQRSMNDNVLYPAMTKSFIYDNMACQQGKGTTAAMDRLSRQMHRYFINHGVDGWVLQCDVQGYYRSMVHDDARKCFERKIDKDTVDMCMKWLERQHPNPVGFEPGSQMVQILGISLLDPLDHFIKERLRAKIYLRYMDDFVIICNDRAALYSWKEAISTELGKVHMHLHPAKTKIYPLKDGISILGFTFRLTETGKVIRLIDPKNVKHERKKLYRMAQMVRNGELSKSKMLECYRSWKAHAELGNSYQLLKRMDKYVKALLNAGKEERYESYQTDRNDPAAARAREYAGKGRAAESDH